jgi:hypothetical protein
MSRWSLRWFNDECEVLAGAASPEMVHTTFERRRANSSSRSRSCVQAAILTLFVWLVFSSCAQSPAFGASYGAASWGPNISGELGVGILEGPETCIEGLFCSTIATELKLTGITEEVVAVAAGNRHSLALLKDGTVLAWGNEESGDLANGSKEGPFDVPKEVTGLSEVTAIAADGAFSLALLKNGTVKAWGENHEGELGDG